MSVEVKNAIAFQCEACGYIQFEYNTLQHGWYEDRYVYQDNIDCEKCKHTNHVFKEQ